MYPRLLYGDMLESSCSEIPLGDTPPEAFGIILEYMYSGKVGKVDLQVCIYHVLLIIMLFRLGMQISVHT